MNRPCKLQMNLNGAWRDVVRFDASIDEHSQGVMDAGATLAGIAQASARIVMDDELQHPRAPEVLLSLRRGSLSWTPQSEARPA